MIPEWCNDYTDLPWLEQGRDRAGVDCWGLLRLIMLEQYGIPLPEYAGIGYREGDDHARLGEFMARHARAWRDVAPGEERTGDAILLRINGNPIHVATVVAAGWMLHIQAGANVALERYRSARWRHRVIGFYRHQDLA